jgi:alkylated DNA repair protein alkB homolog 6
MYMKMNDAAIDFRTLLLEEKKKARKKLQQQRQLQVQQHHDNANVETATHSKISADGCTEKYQIREDDMEAIDFAKLVQEEKEGSLQRQQEQDMADSWSIPHVFDRPQHIVCSDPPTIFYIPSFLPRESDQRSLMGWLQSLPDNPIGTSSAMPRSEKDASAKANGCWTDLQYAKRRVALFDAAVDKNKDKNENMPGPLQRLVDAFVAQGIFQAEEPPNHVLVNEYHPGQGILPHTDGPAYASRTATLSLGSDVLIDFTPRPNCRQDNHQQPQLWLEKGSLVVFQESAYLDYCHGIADRVLEETVSDCCLNKAAGETISRGYRISLTFRRKHAPSRAAS